MNRNDVMIIESLTTKYGKNGMIAAINKLTEAENSVLSNSPRVYVGTYAKYNNGDLTGEWVELNDFSDKEDFIEHCFEIHSDEKTPELMFQDWENIPDSMISESHIDEDFWNLIPFIDEYGYQFIMDVMNECGISDADELESYLDRMTVYHVDSIDDAVRQFVDDCCDLENSDVCERYFDYDSFGYDLKASGAFDYKYEDIEDDDERAEIEDEIDNMSDREAADEYISMFNDLSDAVGKNKMANYFDYDAYARDLSYECEFVESEINGRPVVALMFSH